MTRRLFLVLAVLAAAACGAKSPTDPTPTPDSNEVFYTAVGASDAIGFGGSVVCLPFTSCPNGTGYVQTLGRRMQAAGKTVTLSNLGIPGAVLGPGVEAIGNSIGRDIFGNFLEREMPFVSRSSTLVTIFAGGNDANTIGAALEAGLGGSNPTAYMNTEIANFGRDMRTLVTGIKDRAPQARIVMLNLPNLAALPYVSSLSIDRKRVLQQIAVGMSAQINTLVGNGVFVIDLMCDAAFYQPSIFSSDGFHPNDAGYSYMADVTYPAAVNGVGAPPRSSCSQMSVY